MMKWIIPEISLRLAPVRSVKIAHSYSQAIHFFQPIRPHRRLSRTPPLVAAVGWDPGGPAGNAMGMPWDWGACTQLSSTLDFVQRKTQAVENGLDFELLQGVNKNAQRAPALLSNFDAQLYPVCHKNGGYHGIPQNDDSDGKMMTNQGIRAPCGQINPETSLVTSNFSSGFSFGNFQPVMWHCLKQCQVVLRYISGVVPGKHGRLRLLLKNVCQS